VPTGSIQCQRAAPFRQPRPSRSSPC
jgi:hypothetical protein